MMSSSSAYLKNLRAMRRKSPRFHRHALSSLSFHLPIPHNLCPSQPVSPPPSQNVSFLSPSCLELLCLERDTPRDEQQTQSGNPTGKQAVTQPDVTIDLSL